MRFTFEEKNSILEAYSKVVQKKHESNDQGFIDTPVEPTYKFRDDSYKNLMKSYAKVLHEENFEKKLSEKITSLKEKHNEYIPILEGFEKFLNINGFLTPAQEKFLSQIENL